MGVLRAGTEFTTIASLGELRSLNTLAIAELGEGRKNTGLVGGTLGSTLSTKERLSQAPKEW